MNKTLSIVLLIVGLITLAVGIFLLTKDSGESPSTTPPIEEGVSNSSGSEDPQENLSSEVLVYVTKLESGSVGCGDDIVAIERTITPTSGVLLASLNELFSLPANEFGVEEEYYNALEASTLTVDSAFIQSGVATVHISGGVLVGGVCDEPRFIEQIKRTVLQFNTVSSAQIFVNSTPLEDLFSQQ